ncbi:MAG: hypothetical protein HGGPFJEG_02621 [Ignavibacteria bacterium]|nr:hypothetical protein [Ignavibacteria bacterium]
MRKKILRHKYALMLKKNVQDIFLITLGILSASLGLKGFLIPNGFIDGGVTGISLLLSIISNVHISVFLFLINIPFLAMGYFQISRIFALKSIFAIIGLAVCLLIVNYPVITNDKLLISVFGGISLGAGIGFAIRGGAVIDGTEILSLFLSRKTSATVGDIILIINIFIFSAAAILLGPEPALYSVLTYLAASRTVDFIIEGIEEYTGVTIISEKSDSVRKAIINKLGRGVTIYKGKGGFGKRGGIEYDMDIIFTVITRLEVSKLNYIVNLIDENAFIVQHSIKDTIGGMIKKRPLN